MTTFNFICRRWAATETTPCLNRCFCHVQNKNYSTKSYGGDYDLIAANFTFRQYCARTISLPALGAIKVKLNEKNNNRKRAKKNYELKKNYLNGRCARLSELRDKASTTSWELFRRDLRAVLCVFFQCFFLKKGFMYVPRSARVCIFVFLFAK